MPEITFPSGKKGWVYGVHGVVTSHRKWSETSVSSSGGGGYIHPEYGGRVYAPTVSSTITQRQEFWIQTANGKAHKFSNSVEVAEGHECAILWGNLNQNKNGNHLYFINFTSDRHQVLAGLGNKDFYLTDVDKEELNKRFKKFFYIGLGVAFLYILFDGGEFFDALMGGVMIGIISGIIAKHFAFRKMNRTSFIERRSELINNFRNIINIHKNELVGS